MLTTDYEEISSTLKIHRSHFNLVIEDFNSKFDEAETSIGDFSLD